MLLYPLPRLRFSQLEGDTVDGGCGLFFEVYFVGGHLDEYLGALGMVLTMNLAL